MDIRSKRLSSEGRGVIFASIIGAAFGRRFNFWPLRLPLGLTRGGPSCTAFKVKGFNRNGISPAGNGLMQASFMVSSIPREFAPLKQEIPCRQIMQPVQPNLKIRDHVAVDIALNDRAVKAYPFPSGRPTC